MSKKKNNKKNNNNNNNKINFPYNTPISMAKDQMKQMIDDMPDEVFLEFCLSLESYFGIWDEDWIEEQWAIDEGWENEAEAFYNHYNNSDDNSSLFDEDSLPF